MMKDTELQGDLRDEYLAIQEAEKAYENTSHSAEAQYEEEQALIHEAIAQEQELTEADLDDWYATLLGDALIQEETEIWADFWKDHEDNA